MTDSIRYVVGGTVFAGPEVAPQRLDIRIADGKVAELTSPGSGHLPGDGSDVLDASGAFVLPGFVDCHDHLRNILPGYAFGQGMGIDDFLRAWWESQRLMGPEEYRIGAMLGAVQRLKAGITTVADHCYPYHRPGLDQATIDGLNASGIKYCYARGIMTQPYQPICEPWQEAEARIRSVVADGLIDSSRLFVAPVSLRQTTPDQYRLAVELASELGAGLYTHVAETIAEIEDWKEQTGSGPITALDDIGFLTDTTVLVHCVELGDADIDLIAERGCHVIHCPSNHMKLAKGFTRVPDLLEKGVNVALGVDMMADMLMEIRAEVGLHAIHRREADVVTNEQALAMATVRGAKALGLDSQTGTIEVGKAADLVIIDGRNLEHGPVTDPMYALIYTAHTGMIRDVLIDGVPAVRDGRCTSIDEEAFEEEVEAVTSAYLERMGSDRLWWTQ